MKIQEIHITVPIQDGAFTISKSALQNAKGAPIVKYIGNTEVPIGFVESAQVDESTNEIKFVGKAWSSCISYEALTHKNGDIKLLKISSVNI